MFLSVFFFLLASPPAGQAIPRQTRNVRPCPGLRKPRIFTDRGRKAVEMQTHMNVDVDGAPTAYGPPGKKALDTPNHAHAPKESGNPNEIVGYMTEYPGGPPTVQGKDDPAPGYYVSQTDFADKSIKRMEDPRRYVDASRINYVVQGRVARRNGVKLGDFAVVYSCRTGRTAYAIVADSGNESGAEGSLALVQSLGYNIRNGIEDSVDDPEILIRYYPATNHTARFFRTQPELDQAARTLDLR